MSDRLRYEQDPLMRGSPRISGSRSQSTILTPLPIWRPQTSKDIATKSGETHLRDRALSSCKFLRRSARDICPRAKNAHFSL